MLRIYKTVDEVILDYNNEVVDYPSQFILTGGGQLRFLKIEILNTQIKKGKQRLI